MSDAQPTKARSFPVPAYIRYTFRFLSAVFPYLAYRWALFLFFRPIVFKVPKREKQFREAHQVSTLPYKNQKLPIFKVGNSPSKVILVHGWSGRGSQFFKLAEGLVNAGYEVVTFDAPGHVPGNQQPSHMLEFVDVLLQLEKQYGPFHAAIGHSLGGMALFNATAAGLKIDKLVNMGSPSSIERVIEDFCNVVGADQRIARKLKNTLEERFHAPVESFSSRTIAASLDVKGLIVQDTADMDVALINAEELHQAWPGSTLHITQGLGHRKILNDTKTINLVVGFIAS